MLNELESRIVNIVWVVLAATSGAACSSAETRTSSGALPTDSSTIGTSTSSGADLTMATSTATATATAVAVVTVPPEDPRAPCVAYQAKASSDPKGPRTEIATETVAGFYQPVDVSVVPMGDGNLQCSIVWSRLKSSKPILVAPTCCPQGMRGTPCPPASIQQLPSELSKVETVVLAKDGSVVSRKLVMSQWVAEEPRHHNCGRRPEGFLPSEGGHGPGACLAEMAELEAASISAFDRLARELASHGAPASLVDRARAARRDEIRHARSMRSLARRFGAAPRRVRGRALPVRPPLEVALENAVEGCVFETFGAVVATFQAARAEDPSVRAALVRIAADERAHAALAADVDAWLGGLLTPEQRADVDAARAQARNRLAASRPVDDAATRQQLGLPSASEHAALTRAVCAMA